MGKLFYGIQFQYTENIIAKCYSIIYLQFELHMTLLKIQNLHITPPAHISLLQFWLC